MEHEYRTKSHFVVIASIAAELSAVMEVAKEISLAAANAKAIAFRAGEKAKGFQPITDFINELAKDTIELVDSINDQAISLYILTVNEYQLETTDKKLQLVMQEAQEAPYLSSLQARRNEIRTQMLESKKDFRLHVSQLLEQLGEIMHPARAARVIAANSRIEASQAGEYLQSLQDVAESVDNAAQVIHENVQRCRSALISQTNILSYAA